MRIFGSRRPLPLCRDRHVAALAAALALLALVVHAGTAGAADETIVLNNGRTIDGRIIRADANTVMIQRTGGGMAMARADDIQAVYIPPSSPERKPILGVFLGWKDGAYDLLVNYEPVRVVDGVASLVEPPAVRRAEAAAPPKDDDPPAIDAAAAPAAAVPAAAPAAPVVAARAADDSLVAISVSSEAASEGDPVVFRIELSRPADEVLVLIYASVDGSAKGGEDYDTMNGILSIRPGQTAAELTTPTVADGEAEGSESFAMFVSADRNSATLAQNMIDATIVDR